MALALAQSAAGAQEEPAPADRPAPGAVEQPARRWGMAPIRWGGTLTDDVRWASADGEPDRTSHVQGIRLRAATYLWQPYIAQLSGSLGLTTSNEKSDPPGGGGDASSISGGLALALFPVSRYPFLASYNRTDSRTEGELTSTDYTSTRISLRQSYRPLDRNDTYAFTYDRSMLQGEAFGEDSVDAVSATFTRQLKEQTWEIAGNLTLSDQGEGGGNSRFLRASARHTWRPEERPWTVDSLASVNDSLLHYTSAGLPIDNHSRFLQLNSFATWRPDTEKPLLVTGGLRFFRIDSELGGGGGSSQVLNANAAATYSLDARTSVAGGATLNHTQTDNSSALLGGVNGSISHSSATLEFGKFSYLWHATGSLSQQFSTQDDNQSSLGGGVGHILTRQWVLSPTSSVSLSMNQDLGTALGGATGNHTLSHGASLSWRFTPGETSTGYLSLSGADSRAFGERPSSFQLLNFQANGLLNLSRHASANANLTLQWSRQHHDDPLVGDSSQSSAFGSVSYIHNRFLGFNRLRYSALLNLDTLGVDSRLLGNVAAPRDQVNKSFEQRLDYRVGRLEIRLSARLAEIDGKKNALLFLRVGREFGSL